METRSFTVLFSHENIYLKMSTGIFYISSCQYNMIFIMNPCKQQGLHNALTKQAAVAFQQCSNKKCRNFLVCEKEFEKKIT